VGWLCGSRGALSHGHPKRSRREQRALRLVASLCCPPPYRPPPSSFPGTGAPVPPPPSSSLSGEPDCDVAAVCEQLRALAAGALGDGQADTAAWYADKLVTLQAARLSPSAAAASLSSSAAPPPAEALQVQLDDDAHLLAQCHLRAGQPERGLHTLERYGLLDPQRHANPSRPRPPVHGGVGASYKSLIRDPRLPYPLVNPPTDGGVLSPRGARYAYTAAQCLQAMQAWDRCVVAAVVVWVGQARLQSLLLPCAHSTSIHPTCATRLARSTPQLCGAAGGRYGGPGLPRPAGAARSSRRRRGCVRPAEGWVVLRRDGRCTRRHSHQLRHQLRCPSFACPFTHPQCPTRTRPCRRHPPRR
jgi:hypothetical protein